jgi:extracellular elastinolytic metalloproteinase
MKKSLHLQFLILLVLSAFTPAFGQSGDYLQKSYQHIETKYGLTPESVGELKIRRQYATAHNHVEHLQLVQVYQGIEISGSGINLAFQQNGTVSSVNHNLKMMDKFPVTEKHPKLTMEEAITRAAISLGQPSRDAPGLKKYTDKGIPLYDGGNISLQDIPVQLSYLQTKTGEYRLAYSMYIESAEKGTLFHSWIDAVTGESIANDNMTLHCRFEDGYLSRGEGFCKNEIHSKPVVAPSLKTDGQYYALPLAVESPNHGNFDLLTGVDDPEASPLGWHDSDGITGADHTDTRGNNVHAFPDRDYNYLPDFDVDGGADLIFDFPFDPFADPVDLQEISTTNLFVRTNMMHDFAFQYGFDEAAGNFQQHNYTNEGEGGDYVEAIAQFGASDPLNCGIQTNLGFCANNADFATPPDGMKGRMRMFIWDQDFKNYFLNVIAPSNLAGFLETGLATFGAPITNIPVTGEVVEINDNNGVPSDSSGCDTIRNQPEVAGRIALINRGVCPMSLKILNAQKAGAIGAIICNNEDPFGVINPGPYGAQVTIPAVMIKKDDCERIRLAAGSGLVVSFVVNGPNIHDGALDNGIISHEYAHGISNRLTGTGCLSPGALVGDAQESWAMGEGWSDFFALATTVQPGDTGGKIRGIGTYVNREPSNGPGLRWNPYSTDLVINDNDYVFLPVYGTYFPDDPSNAGSVWGSMLWDLYWAFSDAYGWDPDLYHGTGGNNMAIQLVMDGLKIGPCNPGFIDGRDAILEADMINNSGANQCLIWSTFARRGLGQDATQGDPDSWFDGEAGHVVPRKCSDQLLVTKAVSPEVTAGENIEVTLDIGNYKGFQVTNIFIEDAIPNGCSFVPGSANIEPMAGSTLVWTFDSMDPGEEITITYLVKTDPALRSVRLYHDDMEGFTEDRWTTNSDPMGSGFNIWHQTDLIVHGGLAAWGVEDIESSSEQYLTNNDYYLISGNNPVYRFYHYYDTDKGFDGGVLEIATEADPEWKLLDSEIFRNSYPTLFREDAFGLPFPLGYSGLSSPQKQMDPTYLDLSEYIGEEVKIRYRFSTDDEIPGDGWYVDEVEITDALFYNSEACSISDQTEQYCSSASERGTFVESQIPTATEGDQSTVVFDIMPNPADDLIRVVMSSKKSENAIVSIYNLTGLQLNHSAWNLSEGLNQKAIDISAYASGMYLLQVKTGEGMRSEKFIKE